MLKNSQTQEWNGVFCATDPRLISPEKPPSSNVKWNLILNIIQNSLTVSPLCFVAQWLYDCNENEKE